MDTNEFSRVQRPSNLMHSFAKKMGFLSDVKTNVVSTGFYPFNRINTNDDISAANACNKSLGVIHINCLRVAAQIKYRACTG